MEWGEGVEWFYTIKKQIKKNKRKSQTSMQVECVFEYLSSRTVLKNAKKREKDPPPPPPKKKKIKKKKKKKQINALLTFGFLGLFQKHLASVTIS